MKLNIKHTETKISKNKKGYDAGYDTFMSIFVYFCPFFVERMNVF